MRNVNSKAVKATSAKAPKATKPTKQAAPEAKPEAKKPVIRPTHEIAGSYAGPSPTIRHHARKLATIRTDLGALTVTERDQSFIRDLRAKYADKPFKRYDADAGCVRRAIAHGFLTHVSGDLADRNAEFQLTPRAIGYKA